MKVIKKLSLALVLIISAMVFFASCDAADVSQDLAIDAGLSRAAICSPSTPVSTPYTKDGVGDVCIETTTLCNYINSWNLTTLEINGTAYTNVYVSSASIPAVNGKFVIHYVSTVAWGHFEIGGPCTGNPTPTATVVTRTATTTTLTRTATRTSTTITRTATATRTSTTRTRTATVTRTATGGTITATRTATSTTRTATSNGSHISGNPFSGASWYVNAEWANQISGTGASLKTVSTGIWMDRIGAITAGTGLKGHLDNCVAQGKNLIQIVIYDLPNRDCAAAASNGELLIANGGMARYKTEYIDPIAAIMSSSAYSSLRIICIIEVDSLPNLVTNLSIAKCSEANGAGGYVEGIQYALNKLAAIPNVYNYIDLAHSGWLGWDSNFQPAVNLITNCIKGTTKGVNSIDGFITNTANYTPWEEPYLTDSNLSVGGNPVKAAAFYEFNPYLDEKDFGTAMLNAFVSAGFTNSIGMLCDTSRNGWGGTSYGRSRPTKVSTSTDLNTYVNESRIDRRYHRGNWCNQQAGIGQRPAAAPASGFDAFVWIKPPGESDGVSSAGVTDPNDPAKTFDVQCDPNGMSRYNGNYATGAMTAPHAGRWNQAQFDILCANAYPAL